MALISIIKQYINSTLTCKSCTIGLVFFCILLMTSFFSNAKAETDQPTVYNPYGYPVVSDIGERITYSENEIGNQSLSNTFIQTTKSMPEASTNTTTKKGDVIADWKYFIFGTGIGDSNISVSTVDGTPEIVTGAGGFGFGGNRYWFLLRYNPLTDEYDQSFVSPVTDEGITLKRIISGDFIGGNSPEILVATSTGLIELWNQETRKLAGSFQSAASTLTGMYAADVDNDNAVEIIVCTSSDLYVYDMKGVLEWQLPGIGGYEVIAAQMDADEALEIATTDGSVVDGISHAIQWTRPDGFGIDLEAGDIDGDGYDELIAAESWGFVWAFDIDSQLPKWSIPIFNIGAITLGDIDDDGILELIVGEDQWGGQIAFDTVTLQQEWEINNPCHGTTGVAFGDVDGDGVQEIIWGAGYSSTGADHLFVGDWRNQTIKWSNVDLVGPFRGTAKGDVDGDGIPEIVTVTNGSDSGYGAGRILVFNINPPSLQAISQEVSSGLGWSGTYEVKLRNVDADPELEMLVSSSTTYDGNIEIYDFDGSTFTKIWQIASPLPGGAFRSSEVIDVDGDGSLEVIGGAEQFIYVYDFDTGLEEWHSMYIASYIKKIAIANTDADSSFEILGLGSDGDLYIFDGTSKDLETIIFVNGASLQTYRIPRKPALIFVGDTTGTLTSYRYDSYSYNPLKSVSLASTQLDGFTIYRQGLILSGSGGQMSLHSNWGAVPRWTSESYGTIFATSPKLILKSDQHPIFAAGSYGLVSFKNSGATLTD